jgi:hypothetical protein
MDIAIIITASLTLIAVGAFMYLYLKNEKKNKTDRANDLNELKEQLTVLQNKISETSSHHNEKIEAIGRELKASQDEVNLKISEKLEILGREIKTAQDEANSKNSNNFEQLQTAFKDYSLKVQEALTKYSDEHIELKKSTNQIKEQIQKELKNILTEIKAPLDLD